MIETQNVIDTVEHAKDVAQDALVELGGRLKDADLLPPAITKLQKEQAKRRRARNSTRVLRVLLVLGIVAAVVVWRRRATERFDTESAPFSPADAEAQRMQSGSLQGLQP